MGGVRRYSRYLPFAPSLLTGVIGALWLLFRPLPFEPRVSSVAISAIGVLLAAALLLGAWLLERYLPSFEVASQLLERALRSVRLSWTLVALLAVVTSVSEELFFRGALIQWLGVWGQALVFAVMHPAPLKAWSYTVYTFFAGLVFGYAVILTGSLWVPIIAHFLVNFYGLAEARRLSRRPRRARPRPRQEGPADQGAGPTPEGD